MSQLHLKSHFFFPFSLSDLRRGLKKKYVNDTIQYFLKKGFYICCQMIYRLIYRRYGQNYAHISSNLKLHLCVCCTSHSKFQFPVFNMLLYQPFLFWEGFPQDLLLFSHSNISEVGYQFCATEPGHKSAYQFIPMLDLVKVGLLCRPVESGLIWLTCQPTIAYLHIHHTEIIFHLKLCFCPYIFTQNMS